MKHKPNYLIISVILVSVAAVLGLTAISFAATGSGKLKHLPNSSAWQAAKTKEAAVDKALAASDYQAWLTAVGSQSQQAKVITQDKFPQLIEAYNLTQEGMAKLQQAAQIRKSLGLQPEGWGRMHVKPKPTATPNQ